MKTVIVTGGLGFIGSNLIKYLNKKKFFVVNIDKFSYSSNYNNIPKNLNNYRFYKKDINDRIGIRKILKKHKPLYIFNCAAETHVDRSIDDPKAFIKSNINGLFNLLEEIKYLNKIKLIHISTDEVYGDININSRSKEYDPYKPSSPYAASKAAGDLLIKSYIRTYKINAIITHCCNNYGPNQFFEKFIPTIIYKMIKKKNIPLYGEGLNIREWIYVKDHCTALIKIAQKGINGETYNIGSGNRVKNIKLVKKIIKIFKKLKNIKTIKSKILLVKDRPGHDFCYSLDSTKIKKAIKWKCRIDLENGLKKTIVWYLNYFSNKTNLNKNHKRLGLKND